MIFVWKYGRGQFRWPWLYFHSKAEDLIDKLYNGEDEDWNAPDLVSGDVDPNSLKEGEHDVMIHGQHPAILFKWHSGDIPRGLICLPDDERAIEYARKCMREKRDHI